MYHIEFLGPSGAGKTTLRRELVSKLDGALGGAEGKYECCRRTSRFAFLFKYSPELVRRQLWKRYLRPHFRKQYENRYPETLRVRKELVEIVGTDTIGPHVDEEMALYQLYSSTTQSDEPVVIDDGLYQFHLHLVEHDIYGSLGGFLPTPDVLIYTYAPPETCLRRQESRNRGRAKLFAGLDREVALENLRRTIDAADRVVTDLEDQDTLVIQVSTENSMDSVCEKIFSELS